MNLLFFWRGAEVHATPAEVMRIRNPRFMALVLLVVIAYSLATCAGQVFQSMGVNEYVTRLQEAERRYPRHSEFGMGLYGYAWGYAMEIWAQWADLLMQLKPHKTPYFKRGLDALAIVKSTL